MKADDWRPVRSELTFVVSAQTKGRVMCKRFLFAAVSLTVILITSCKRSAKTDPARDQATGSVPAVTEKLQATPIEQAQIVTRWNAVAGNDTVNLRGFGPVDFRWNAFDKFPHPTYKGGSDEAYATLRSLLAAFFQHGDNFDYLSANGLFTVELRYVFESGQVGVKTTFAKLAADMGRSEDAPDDETRKTLRSFSDRIEATLKK